MPPACPLQKAPGWCQKCREVYGVGPVVLSLLLEESLLAVPGLSQHGLLLGLLLTPSLKLQQTCGGI